MPGVFFWRFILRQSEIERALVLVYRSNNAHDAVNFARPAGSTDFLSMNGLKEYAEMLDRLREDVENEIKRREGIGQTVYSPRWYEIRAKAH